MAELIEAGEITAETGKSALALVGASPATPASSGAPRPRQAESQHASSRGYAPAAPLDDA